MADATGASVVVSIVGWPPARERRSQFHDICEETLRLRVVELAQDLELPAELTPTLEIRAATAGAGPSPYEVRIDGQLCRRRVAAARLWNESDGRTAGNCLAEALLSNRQLLANAAVIGDVRARLRTPYWSEQPDGEVAPLTTLVCSCITEGYSLGAVREFLELLQSDADVEEAVEGTLHISGILPRRPHLDVLLSPRTAALASAEQRLIDEVLPLTCDGMFYELGLELPRLELLADPGLDDRECRLRFHDVRERIVLLLEEGQVAVNESADRLTLLNLRAQDCLDFSPRFTLAFLAEEHSAICEQAGCTTYDRWGYLALRVADQVRQLAPYILTTSLAERGLGLLMQAFPQLVFSLIESSRGVNHFAAVLRQLLAERVSVRNLRLILDLLLGVSDFGNLDRPGHKVVLPPHAPVVDVFSDEPDARPSAQNYADYVRFGARAAITQQHAGLFWVRLEDHFETALLSRKEPLTEIEQSSLIASVAERAARGRIGFITTSRRARRVFRARIAVEFPDVPVLCREEFTDKLSLSAWFPGPRAQAESPPTASLVPRGTSRNGLSSSPSGDPIR